MATYSRTERLAAIQKAGFSNPLTALAVSLAEFGENRDINAQSQSDYYSNGVREQSFGPWQLHLPTWGKPSNLFPAGITQVCAMDLTCSTNAAAKISKSGTNFGDWSAFTNGSYSRFLPDLTATFSPPTPGPIDTTLPGDTTCQPGWHVQTFELGPLKWNKCVPDDLSPNPFTPAPGHPAAKNPLPDVTSLGTFLGQISAPDNLWRAGFLIVGAVLMFAGARLYLAPDRSEVGHEVVA